MQKAENPTLPPVASDAPPINDDGASAEAINKAAKKQDKERRFARDIAYGVQQTFACWITDFIDPPISNFLQNTFGNKKHKVTHGQTFGGEAIGDTSAFFIFVAAKRFLGKPIDALIAGVKNLANPLLTKAGKGSIKPWAEAHGVKEGDERYEKKLEEYKDFQAENMVDSSIISMSATGVNVFAQRALGNKQSLLTILGSKIVGATLTLGVMFLTRFFLPTSTKALDDEISERYAAKGIRLTKKILGIQNVPESQALIDSQNSIGHFPATLAPEKHDGLLKIMLEKAAKTDVMNDEAARKMLGEAKDVFKAMMQAFAEGGYMVSVMAREYHDAMEKTSPRFNDIDTTSRSISREEAYATIQAAAAEKRHDLKLIMALMDDPKFLQEIRDAVAKGKTFDIVPTKITDEEKHRLSASLLSSGRGSSDVLDNAERKADEYKALAHTLDPAGVVATIFAQEMQKHLPHESTEEVNGIAKDYMHYYRHEAKSRAELFSPDKPLVRQAQERAQSLRDKYLPINNAPQVAMSA